jgi:hypothetical protein
MAKTNMSVAKGRAAPAITMLAAAVLLGSPVLAQQTPPPRTPETAPSQPNTQRQRLFPAGRCDTTEAAIAISRGEVGVASRGGIAGQTRDGAHGYTVGQPGCRVRIIVIPEGATQPNRRAPARPFQEPFQQPGPR